CMLAIRHATKVKEDAALGLVLGCFFGAGVVLKGFLQGGGFGDASGIDGFLEGSPAALLRRDAWLIAGSLVAVMVCCLLLYKEFRLLCFDSGYAQSQGWNVVLLDILLMTLVSLVVIVGLQAVGLVLMIAMLVIPPAAARFWTRSLGRMCLISSGLGLVSGYLGTLVSTTFRGWPAGASIVLCAAALFVFSMLLGRDRGLVIRWLRRRRFDARIEDDNLLRSIYELAEHADQRSASMDELFEHRGWSRRRLQRIVARAQRNDLVSVDGDVQLTDTGVREAHRIVRNHRLWERYMLAHADVAASHVDRGADLIEHVLGDELVAQLERDVWQPRANMAAGVAT
ncbi:MAG: metal ABC transporter permease, partial [Planctomycetota bacterium]